MIAAVCRLASGWGWEGWGYLPLQSSAVECSVVWCIRGGSRARVDIFLLRLLTFFLGSWCELGAELGAELDLLACLSA